ncbi:DUF1569 domain-containing protein [Leptospira sp. GIMC2001]|uniref:DUF1569 domain-containing protein n=1 Tax=Leptospira sp. GIMC2001 TaxID=1513297 RepID=UPI00234BEE2C|nr:DUF1569 domain-containing protein [Leptospira sp. GIMC2001]WCL47710.1 DUF1569 domain-containing protein [Leptospira sp. GIMC2001]
MRKINTINDLEFECGLLEKCNHKTKSKISVSQLLNSVAEGIESSITGSSDKTDSFISKIIKNFKLKKFSSQASWDPKWKIHGVPTEFSEGDWKDSLVRLKTSITAFKLHSGPFANHPDFGQLDKPSWEIVHLKVADYLLGQIEIEGREKFQQPSAANPKNKKYYKNKKFHHKKKKFKGEKH